MKTSTRKLTLSALFLALGLVLPLITGQIPQIGKMLLPMHIPVLLCGMVCGWPYGLAVGAVMPLLRGLLFGMPVLYPTGIGMAFELAAYGAVIGLLYAKLNKRGVAGVYMALVPAMLAGRAVWGVAQTVLLGLGGNGFTMQMFIAGAFATALPGIVLQLVLIPVVMVGLEHAGVLRDAVETKEKYKGNTVQFPPCGLSTAPAAAARHLRCQNAR